jgi:hypothetical protein
MAFFVLEPLSPALYWLTDWGVFCVLCLWYWGLNLSRQVLYHLSHSTSPVWCWVFSRKGPVNYLPWLALNCDPMISAFWVARITGVSHRYLVTQIFIDWMIELKGCLWTLNCSCIGVFWFWWDWGLNSGLWTCQTGALWCEPYLQSIFLWLFWRWGSFKLFAGASLEPQSYGSQLPK